MKHFLGEIELSATQLKAAEILISRTVPAVASIEHSGEVQHSYVARMPEVANTTEQWQQHYSPIPTLTRQ